MNQAAHSGAAPVTHIEHESIMERGAWVEREAVRCEARSQAGS